MTDEIIKKLLEAGVHFGHQTKRWNPKMAKFIFGKRNSIYIIDLEKTAACLKEAKEFLKELTRHGETVLFVGTKRQAQEIIKEKAAMCGMYSICYRWPGGLLTNFNTIKKSVERLKEIDKMKEDGRMQVLTKKEAALLMKDFDKLERSFGGIRSMEQLPKALFVIDPKKEETAVREANKLKIPVVALIDTNCNPEEVTYPIPGNDDAIKSIAMITTIIAESVAEGRKGFLDYLGQTNVKPVKDEQKDAPLEPQVQKDVVEEKIIELVEEKVVEDGSPKKVAKPKDKEDTRGKRRAKK